MFGFVKHHLKSINGGEDGRPFDLMLFRDPLLSRWKETIENVGCKGSVLTLDYL